MFLENVFRGKNDIGRWIAMLVILIIGTQIIGLIPLGIKIILNLGDNPDLVPNPENALDLSAYDISPVTGLVLMMIPFAVGLIALLALMKPIHERPMLSVLTGGPSFRWKRFFWGAGIWLILMIIYSVITIATGLQEIELQFDPKTLISLVVVSVLLLPLQTGFEETFFRGYLMQGFARIFHNRWVPLLFTAFLFGGLHYFNPEVKAFGLAVMMPQYVWFGIFFGLCTLMDDGLELAWGVHAVNNIFLSIFFTQESSAILTPALFNITYYNPVTDLIGLVILSLLFLYLASRRFAWPKWRQLAATVENPFKDEEESEFGDYALIDEYEDDNDKI
jgi:uncharacterized protein